LVAIVLGTGLGSALLGSLGLMPLVGQPTLSLSGYTDIGPDLWRGAAVSVAIAAAATALAAGVGLLTALVVVGAVSSLQRGRRWILTVASLTVPIPHLVGATAIGLLLADAGVLPRWLGIAPLEWPDLVGGPWWAAVVLEYAWKESAFVALVVFVSLATRVHSYDESARLLGAGWWQRMRWVTFPLAASPLLVSSSIAFAYAVGTYEVAWLLGRTYPEPLPVLAYRLFTSIDLAARPQALAVAVATTMLAGLAAAIGLVAVRAVERIR